MTVDDLNEVKAAVLASSESDTYLSFTSSMIKDMRGNNVTGKNDSRAIKADSFEDDLTPPSLVSFDLNMTSESLTLVFSETVSPDSVSMTAFSLQSAANGSAAGVTQFDLTGGNVSTAIISTKIVVVLTKDDINSIKALPSLAVDDNTSFLVMSSDGVKDVTGNNVTAVAASAAAAVSEFTADVTLPELLYFSLDLHNGVMLASFSETINGSSFDPSQITLQSVKNGTSAGALSYKLTGGTNVSSTASVNVSFDLLKEDTDAIKVVDGLATGVNDTFVSATSALVSDMNSNVLSAIENTAGLASADHTADNVAPHVVQFTFDLNAGVINISMSEPVADSINVTALAFVSSGDTTGYALTSGSNVTLGDGQRFVQIAVSTTDLNEIQARPLLATSEITTVLQLRAAFGKDKTGNEVIALELADNKTAAAFVEDIVAPTLSSFVLDLSANQLALTFSETVDGSGFNATSITLVGTGSAKYTLTNGSNDGSFSTVVVVNLTTTDINAIKREPLMGVSVNNTFLSILTTTVADMSRLGVAEINVASAKQASDVINDIVLPELVEYSLDMNALVLQLSFSEPVNVDVFDVTTLTFVASSISGSGGVTLTGGVVSSMNMSSVNVSLTVSDSNAIKADSGLCTNTSNTFLNFTNATVSDIYGNAVVAPTVAVQANEHTPDTTPPVLSGAELDMNAGVLTMNFTETVKASSVNASRIGFGSSSSSGALVSVGSDSVISSSDTEQVTIQLSNATLNSLKLDARVGTSESDTFVVMQSTSVLDMSSVAIESQVLGDVEFVTDTTDPELESFELDMHNGVLSMTFTEAVNVATFNASGLTLQGGSGSSSNVTVSGGYVASANGTTVLVNLTVSDLNAIKQKLDLATSKLDTYVSLFSSLIEDMFTNQIVLISTSSAQQASEFYNDERAATLEWFSLDMDAGVVLLNFSETMNVSSLVVNGRLALQSAVNSTEPGEELITLQGEVAATRDDSDVVLITLLKDDLEAIKLTDKIGTADVNTFMSFSGNLVSDQNGVATVSVANTAAQQAAVVVNDSTAPLLTTVVFDLGAGMLNLSFSETVRNSTLDMTTIQLQNAVTAPSQFVPLGAGSVIGSDGLELTVKLSKEELDEVTQKTSLCYTNATCVIHVGTDAVDDMAGNTMQSITRGISDFVGDSIAPTLVTFNFTNDGLGKVILEFSETMDQGSLNISAITLQDNSTSNVTYTLIGASNSDSDGTIFTISMNKTEADALKTLGICITQDVCFIVLDSTAMKDMSAFDVDAVVDGDARQATSVSPDVANPNFISSVEFDYNAETLTLSFDEPVIPSTLNASAVTLADDDEDISVFSPAYKRQHCLGRWKHYCVPVCRC
jgi:hypothetical protein